MSGIENLILFLPLDNFQHLITNLLEFAREKALKKSEREFEMKQNLAEGGYVFLHLSSQGNRKLFYVWKL